MHEDWHNFFNCVSDGIDSGIDSGTYRIFEPEWKAEILQWFGRSDVALCEKEAFIEALIEFDDNCAGFYRYRAYFLAAEALANFPECSRGDEIICQLLQWSYIYFQEKAEWTIYPKPLASAARETLKATDKKLVVAAFENLLHITESRHVLRHAAERLGELDPGNTTAIAALLGLVRVARCEGELVTAASSPIKIDPGNETAIATLVKLTENTVVTLDQLQDIISQLGKIDPGHPEAIAALILLTQITEKWFKSESCYQINRVREEAAQALSKIGIGDEAAILALAQFVESNPSPAICCYVAANLIKGDPRNDKAIAALAQRLESNTHPATCCYLAVHLLQLDSGNEQAIATLKQILKKDPSHYLRWRSATALQPYGDYSQIAIDALTQEIYAYPYDYEVQQTVPKLEAIAVGNEKAIAALSQFLQNSEYEPTARIIVAESLAKIAPGNPAAINALVRLLETADNEWYLPKIAASLGRIDPGNEMALATLIQCIRNCANNVNSETNICCIIDSLENTIQNWQMPQLVTALKDYLSETSYQDCFELYQACYNLIWNCAQKMTYPEFHKAWQAK